MLTHRLPRDIPHAIEARQAEGCPDPEISIWRLGGGNDAAFGKTLSDFPGRMRILADIQRGIQRQRTWTPHQQASQNTAWCEGESYSSAHFPHRAPILRSFIPGDRQHDLLPFTKQRTIPL